MVFVGLIVFIPGATLLYFLDFPISGFHLLIALAVYCIFARWYLRRARFAKVAAGGLELADGTVIPFAATDRIVNEGDGFPSVVFSADIREKVRITGKDFISLAFTRLNQWVVEKEELTVTPGEPGQEFSVKYSRRGKYGTTRLDRYINWVTLAVLFLTLVGPDATGLEELKQAVFILLVLVLLILAFKPVIPLYKKIRVSVTSDGIVLVDENKVERTLKFRDITAVAEGFFQIKVTTKTGDVYYFPQGCVLLSELIKDQAGL